MLLPILRIPSFFPPHTVIEETPRRGITVTSSLNEIFTDPLGNRVVVRWERRYSARPAPLWIDI
jgi:hypothetical protein